MKIKFIDRCKEKCLKGIPLTRNEIISLLEIPIGSEDDLYLRKAAREAAMTLTDGCGRIWCAVGMDFAPCPMNCKFCSFGEAWNLIPEERHVDEKTLLDNVRKFVENGAAFIVLRTTEFYHLEFLLEFVQKIREEIPGDYGIVLNTGELDDTAARKVAESGVFGVYHALRLREGQDTAFDPEKRIRTMQSVSHAGLSLVSLVEPLGPEHTNEEIADAFLTAVSAGVKISGTMARFPVPGTPLGNTEMIDEEKICHVIAALRLSGGFEVQDICVHPASQAALESGANVMVVETGAIPRDSDFSESEWADVGMAKAGKLLTDAGFRISTSPSKRIGGNKKCACEGGNLEKFMKPIMLCVLQKESLNGYGICKRLEKFATFRDSAPDMAATYRCLKQMEKSGLLTSTDGVYSITTEGNDCFNRWKKTLKEYQILITNLLEEFER